MMFPTITLSAAHSAPDLYPDPAGGPKPEAKRSPHWPATAAAHLKKHPACEVCGAKVLLNVHHVKPFHLFPELELDPQNLFTLCETPAHNCHLIFGHLLLWRAWNPNVVNDATVWAAKIECRRTGAI
jgi:hypothetical protein